MDSVDGPNSELSTLRQLRILVVLLLVSNIGLGIVGFYFLRALDQKYSTLIGQTVPTLNDLQTLTAVSMETMRSTNPTLLGESAQSRSEMVERSRLALERDRDLRGKVLKREWLAANAAEKLDFQNAGEAFIRTAEQVLPVLESGDVAAATRQREEMLRPAFNRYVAATTKAADVLETESLQASNQLSARTGNISNMMLGLASWPVMVLCLFLLITAVFVIAVLVKVFFSPSESW